MGEGGTSTAGLRRWSNTRHPHWTDEMDSRPSVACAQSRTGGYYRAMWGVFGKSVNQQGLREAGLVVTKGWVPPGSAGRRM